MKKAMDNWIDAIKGIGAMYYLIFLWWFVYAGVCLYFLISLGRGETLLRKVIAQQGGKG